MLFYQHHFSVSGKVFTADHLHRAGLRCCLQFLNFHNFPSQLTNIKTHKFNMLFFICSPGINVSTVNDLEFLKVCYKQDEFQEHRSWGVFGEIQVNWFGSQVSHVKLLCGLNNLWFIYVICWCEYSFCYWKLTRQLLLNLFGLKKILSRMWKSLKGDFCFFSFFLHFLS